MSSEKFFAVAVIGAGPAGLSAALLLGRSRRSVVVIDHGQPRNYAAAAVHGYLGLDGIKPNELRARGRENCSAYGVDFINDEVIHAECLVPRDSSLFRLKLKSGQEIEARKLLLATGVSDDLPNLPSIATFYGVSVHHCPYCDAWEHRDRRLVAFSAGSSVVELALTLRSWSEQVTACTNGYILNRNEQRRLELNRITYRADVVVDVHGPDGRLTHLTFEREPPLHCDAFFFGAGQGQRSKIPVALGCKISKEGLIQRDKNQASGIEGLFVAGDLDGEVQFAIMAAAEGAIAATAIDKELRHESEILK
jgi:thioredoxin reductase